GKWCPWPGSNQHSLRNSILSRARLPIPPQGPLKGSGKSPDVAGLYQPRASRQFPFVSFLRKVHGFAKKQVPHCSLWVCVVKEASAPHGFAELIPGPGWPFNEHGPKGQG